MLAYDTKLYILETPQVDAVSEGEHAMKLYILATEGNFSPPLHPIYHNYFIHQCTLYLPTSIQRRNARISFTNVF